MKGQSSRVRPGFAMPELAAVFVVALLTIALALPAARRARLAGWDVVDAENLHRFAAATSAYAADNGDRYWTFSWKKGDHGGEYNPATDLEATEGQAIDLLRRKAGRQNINWIPGWFPHLMYSQLPLYDYLDQQMPALWGVCPADASRLAWAQNPAGFDEGEFLPDQPLPSNSNKRWPYSSSYQLPAAFYDRGEAANRVSQAGTHSTFIIPDSADLGAFRVTDVAFPSQKVQLHEEHQWDFGPRAPFFGLAEARVTVLMADGSGGSRASSDANRGWLPNNPASPDPTYITYAPQTWEPRTVNGQPSEVTVGYFRWTRQGLAGRDVGGPEVGLP